MVLRTIAFLFFAAAVVTGFSLGWGESLGTALYRLNAPALNSLQAGVQRHLVPELWDALFVPLLNLPAWSGWAVFGIIFLAIAMLRPGRG
jgi:hypothetical protein